MSVFDTITPIDYSLEINGVRFSPEGLAAVLSMVTQPNPDRWYQFEVKNGVAIVHTRVDEKRSPNENGEQEDEEVHGRGSARTRTQEVAGQR